MTLTASGSISGTSAPGATTTRPSGLPSSVASLAMNLELPMPTEAVRPPVAVATAALSSATSVRSPASVSSIGPAGLGQVDERLVQRQRLHRGRQRPQDAHHLAAGGR